MTEAVTPIREKETETVIAPPPKKYFVVVRDNKVTDMDFVVGMLSEVFNMDNQTAKNRMMEVHTKKRTSIGPYSRDVAETKKNQCMDYAAKAVLQKNRELLTTIEPAP